MDSAALASSIISMQAGHTQMQVAAMMMRQNLKAQSEVVQILNAGNNSLANVGAGIGGQLNISA